MDIATIIGIISAFGLVIYAITLGGPLSGFVDTVSIIIVVCGTIGVVFIAYPLKEVLGVFKVILKNFIYKTETPSDMILKLIEIAQLVRKEGILALEPISEELSNLFLKNGIKMAIDGQEPSEIEEIMQSEIDQTEERHKKGADMMTAFGTFAPSMGMIGTLIGLVLMLQNMADPASIGPAMSVALLTTFYGALMANLVFLPFAGKLKVRSKAEILIMNLILSGILSIGAGENPRLMESKLLGFLPPSERKSAFD